MKKRAKKITMEVLAGMVQRGFLNTAGRFDTVEADLKSVKEDVKSLKEDFHKILDALDKVAKHYDDYLKEATARDTEVKRIKRWVEQIAQKVGVELVD